MEESRKVSLIGLLVLHLATLAHAQEKIDTLDIINTAKFNMHSYLVRDVKTKEYFKDFIEYVPTIKYLKSDGFGDDFFFFQVIPIDYSDNNKIIYKDSLTVMYRGFFAYNPDTFVYGYNVQNHYLYRIFPYDSQDVTRLFKHLLITPTERKLCFGSLSDFSDCYYIESISMKYLYQAYKMAQSSSRK
jgi:hypothetical protein